MKFAIAADSHASVMTWARHPNIKGDGFWGIKKVLEFCVREKLDLLYAGDLLDKERITSNVFTTVEALFKAAVKDGFRGGVIIAGNHDPVPTQVLYPPELGLPDGKPWVGCIPGMTWFDDDKLQLCPGWVMRAVSYKGPADFADMVRSLGPKENVLMIHQSAKQLMGFVSEASIDLDDLPETVRLVIIGDTHVSVELKNKHGAVVISPGSTKVTEKAEAFDKYVYTVDLEENGSGIKAAREKIPTRSFLRLSVPDAGGIPNAVAQIRGLSADPRCPLQPVVFADVNLDAEGALKAMRAACEETGAYLVTKPVRVKETGETVVLEEDAPWQDAVLQWHRKEDVEFPVIVAIGEGLSPKEQLRGMRQKIGKRAS